ncbi:hypothetical protein FOPG_19743 [Fusarium oxysporum f. sp. conglutinans race 2 54008]|uniref:Uncharacterized protein n=1 Tax=Fusarium oxysporum f. sp. conglutinans race 2 54008 TaxID=1089457 RepID=X0GK26_FUSOX|nr:hypothetical protein FOPG_19743 [Fusarium oxysporum f. sp. conglutinans race 2 54008]
MKGAASSKVYCGAPAYRASKSDQEHDHDLDGDAEAETSTPLSGITWKLRRFKGLAGWT